MARLFVAIDFPEHIQERLANLCFGVPKARWVPVDQLHLTLRFIGDTDDSTYHAIVDELDAIRVAPFDLKLKGAGHFPPRRDPNVLWAGVEESRELMSLAAKIEAAVQKAGVEPEKRRFHPHVTLARFKDRVSMHDIIPFLSANNLFATEPIAIHEFHLYSSILGREHAVHTIEETFTLE